MSNAVAIDLVVRVCRRHDLILEEQPDGSLVCPARPRHKVTGWKVVDRRRGRALYEATAEGGTEKGDERKAPSRDEEAEPKVKMLERQRFQDGTGAILWLHLLRVPAVFGGDPFRIRWSQGNGQKGTTRGVSKTSPDEAAGRLAFKAAVREAAADGWKPVEITRGARQLVLKPIPKPKKRAS